MSQVAQHLSSHILFTVYSKFIKTFPNITSQCLLDSTLTDHLLTTTMHHREVLLLIQTEVLLVDSFLPSSCDFILSNTYSSPTNLKICKLPLK